MKNRIVSISLAMVLALSFGLVGCASEEVPETTEYDLTISSTDGGSVTTPGEGTFTYDEGEVVNLVAKAEEGYCFRNWTGDVDTIGDVDDASTAITINGRCGITATFEAEEAVLFADPNLEASIREMIGIHARSIYPSDLKGLRQLGALRRDIADLTGLEYCVSLTILYIGYNQIRDISPLANLTSLTDLYLACNQISDVAPVTNLTSLTLLQLQYNQISDISPLADLTSLTGLELTENQISDILPLANLTSLTLLGLMCNEISDISPVASLTGLTGLYLTQNQIGDISPLANLTSLTDLYLGINRIGDISPLANLTSLTCLYLQDNQISDISPLANLTSLTYLYLEDNQISDIGPLLQNEGLATGDTVSLGGNPLSSDSINVYIPKLVARGVTVYH